MGISEYIACDINIVKILPRIACEGSILVAKVITPPKAEFGSRYNNDDDINNNTNKNNNITTSDNDNEVYIIITRIDDDDY